MAPARGIGAGGRDGTRPSPTPAAADPGTKVSPAPAKGAPADARAASSEAKRDSIAANCPCKAASAVAAIPAEDDPAAPAPRPHARRAPSCTTAEKKESMPPLSANPLTHDSAAIASAAPSGATGAVSSKSSSTDAAAKSSTSTFLAGRARSSE